MGSFGKLIPVRKVVIMPIWIGETSTSINFEGNPRIYLLTMMRWQLILELGTIAEPYLIVPCKRSCYYLGSCGLNWLKKDYIFGVSMKILQEFFWILCEFLRTLVFRHFSCNMELRSPKATYFLPVICEDYGQL